MSESKIITMRYDKFLEMKAKAEMVNRLIFCYDCDYWNPKGYCRRFNLNQGQFNPDLEAYVPMDADDFCSYGEKGRLE